MKFTDFLNESYKSNEEDANPENLKAFKLAIKKNELIDLVKDVFEESYITRGAFYSAHSFKVKTDDLFLSSVYNDGKGKVRARIRGLVEFYLTNPEDAEGTSFDIRPKNEPYYYPIMYSIDLNKIKLADSELDHDYDGNGTYKDAVKRISEYALKITY